MVITTPKAAAPKAPKITKPKLAQPTAPLDKRLILNQWLLRLFGFGDWPKLADLLNDPEYEGYTAQNNTQFLSLLQGLPKRDASVSSDMLREYDENLVRHWKDIVERREQASGQPLYMKYFQYLALLFTEIYLDQMLGDKDTLRGILNSQLAYFNTANQLENQLEPYSDEDLSKVAFMQATGSGKTLLMHVNIKQYRHYLDKYGRASELNRVILLTPNEGLSQQHLEEFGRSNMEAELFRKDGGKLFTSQSIEIIDIHKLANESGDKTVAVDAFEGNNLVLVDEGHRGSGGEDWMSKRRRLAERGFSFEYSATFKQALKAAKDARLTQEYAKCIIFDYSYKYFYTDGYGKDYAIQNLADDSQADVRDLYLMGGLLAFYQQMRLHHDRGHDYRAYLLEQPLLVFVGGRVSKGATSRDISDILDILLFLANLVHPRNSSPVRARIVELLRGAPGLLDKEGRALFANSFCYLNDQNLGVEQIYSDILRLVFGAQAAGVLRIENLKSADGEIALRVGNSEPFGVINVGDAASVIKQVEAENEKATKHGAWEPFAVREPEFAGSLFARIKDENSPLTVLIGAKRFIEGWSSWRVSTMGLMNIGQNEGSQIIQLFGRGVRLKGYGYGLKRSSQVQKEQNRTPPKYIEELETLNIFGVRADYMDEFRAHLEEEGVKTDTLRQSFTLPTLEPFKDKLPPLQLISVKDGVDFKRAAPTERPTLAYVDKITPVKLDWYPKIDSRRSGGVQRDGDVLDKNVAKLSSRHLALMDWDAMYFALERYKAEKSYANLNVTRQNLRDLLLQPNWYILTIPEEALRFTSMERVRVWQEIAVALLKKYCDSLYKFKKSEYELPHLEYRQIDPADKDAGNFIKEYEFQVEVNQRDLLMKLQDLKIEIERVRKLSQQLDEKALKLLQVTQNNYRPLTFERHLYEPLIYLKSDLASVKPVALNTGECDFVDDLRVYHAKKPALLEECEVYLLRNQSRKGIGFFEAGNFYPDFILWVLRGDTRYVTFLDPKGIRNLEGAEDPKISFFATIKKLEQQLGVTNIVLNSFIIANTPHDKVKHWKDDTGKYMDIAAFKQRNVYFQYEERKTYLGEIFEQILR